MDDNRHKRIPASAVRGICGDISDMTLWRWLNDPDKEFPEPVFVGRRRYWREADILEWWDRQGRMKPDGAAA